MKTLYLPSVPTEKWEVNLYSQLGGTYIRTVILKL